jgi:hypothetical protein
MDGQKKSVDFVTESGIIIYKGEQDNEPKSRED